MGIPCWRIVTDTDEGCTIFQCLNCKNKWESRTPVFSRWVDINWKFCPYCGCEWKGEKHCYYLRGEKHRFIAGVYGRELPWRQPNYRYQILQYCNILHQWDRLRDFYPREFFLTPFLVRQHLVSNRRIVVEELRKLRTPDRANPFQDTENPIKVVLERRENDKGYIDDWVPISEKIFPPKTS